MPAMASRELISVENRNEMRFLTIVTSLRRGGTERAAVNYALGYKRAGFASAVLAYTGGGPREAQLAAEGVEAFVGGENAAEVARAIEAAKAWNPDILHINRSGQTDAGSAAVLRALIHPRLRVLETNVFGYADRSPDRAMIDVHMQLSRWCMWKWTESVRGLNPPSLGAVLPYSVDCGAFAPPADAEEKRRIRRDFGIPENAFVYGRIGQPSMAKWSPMLVQAFAAVAKELPQAWLAVCGMPDQMKQMVKAFPAEIRARVVELPITNSDTELHRYYGLMDVFVHAADKGESFGLVLCEAMLSGLPVITLCTPLRDNSQIEVVPPGKAGIVVSGLEQITGAMLRLARNAGEYEQMRANALSCVQERFDIPVVNRQLVKIASIALAANSQEELKRGLGQFPGLISRSTPDEFRQLLAEAGIRQSFRDDLLTAWINRPSSRQLIRLTRTGMGRIQKLLRGK